jgi:tRNA pseudouridine(55) synthase
MYCCYSSDAQPINYSEISLIEVLKTIQPFLTFQIKSYYVNPSSGFTTILVECCTDNQNIKVYQQALKDKDISLLPDHKYCHFNKCYKLNSKSNFCTECHNKIVEEQLNEEIIVSQFKTNVLRHVYHLLEKKDITPPDNFVYKNTQFLSDHRVIKCWKKIGETPLIMMKRVIKEHGIPDHIKTCYTGRLDPMAQGVSIILTGSQNTSEMKKYCAKSKTYSFQAILGIETDSYDALGNITNYSPHSITQVNEFIANLEKLNGSSYYQEYPAMSAYKYKGKPLWKHQIEGTLPDKMPGSTRQIYSIKIGKPVNLIVSNYAKECISDINDVKRYCGNSFHSDDKVKQWRTFSTNNYMYLWRITITAKVSSGTYIRSIVVDTARKLNLCAHAFRITRIQHD